MNMINAALQILPQTKNNNVYAVIDKVIDIIKNSGITYEVCPFETVMEGEYDKIMEVIKQAQETCFNNGADEVLVYIKIQNRDSEDVHIEEKMHKYRNK